jgi:pyruvate formate lyase activating enzyme
MLFRKSNKGFICTLCPHFCDMAVGKKGFCKVREADENGIFLNAYGLLTHIAVEPIEKKPLKHYLEGTKTLSLGSYSCNQFCAFCENSAYSQKERPDRSKYYSPSSVVALAQKKDCASVCMTYNEPIIYYEYLLDVITECKYHNIAFILKTGAYINPEPWQDICKNVDAINVDWKGIGQTARRVTGVENTGILQRIKEAFHSGVHIEISIPVYHGIVEEGGFEELGECLSFLSPKIPVHLLKVYPANRHLRYPTTPDEEISVVYNTLSTYLDNVHSPISNSFSATVSSI